MCLLQDNRGIQIMPKEGQKSVTISGGILNWLEMAYDEYSQRNVVPVSFAGFVAAFAKLGYEEWRIKNPPRNKKGLL